MDGLEDRSLLDQMLDETRILPSDEGFDIAKQGLEALVSEILTSSEEVERIDKNFVDAMIGEIDRIISAQLNEILHHESFQKLESAWRSLKYLVDNVSFRDNINLSFIDVSKEDLLEDFDDAPEVPKSGLYRLVYSSEYGTFGGKPHGLMISTYDFSPSSEDMQLLRYMASVSAMAHAPFIGNAGPQFFGCTQYEELAALKDLKSIFEGPQYTRWRSFRESEDARYVGLTLPRFLLRLPYTEKSMFVKSFGFNEEVAENHNHYLWGPCSFVFAARVADSFAKYRWCPNVVGPSSGGAVDGLVLHQYEAMGEIQTKCPLEVQLTERREYELSEEGFIGLTFRKDSDSAAFFSANSCQKPKLFGDDPEGKEAEANYRIGTQLPYLFITTRLAHYLKVLQREQIGSWKEKQDLQRELNKWISKFVADMESPSPDVRSRRPLRKAEITVEDVEGQPGWYRCGLRVQPHFKYMGASFTLSLVGKLDKK